MSNCPKRQKVFHPKCPTTCPVCEECPTGGTGKQGPPPPPGPTPAPATGCDLTPKYNPSTPVGKKIGITAYEYLNQTRPNKVPVSGPHDAKLPPGTTANLCNCTSLLDTLFPKNNSSDISERHTMQGMKQLYDETRPFVDPLNPTINELDQWNKVVLDYVRSLYGMPPIQLDKNLFLTAQWSQERNQTTYWNDKYPENSCAAGAGAHCGWTFVPSAADQIPYLCKPDDPPVTEPPRSEGVLMVNNVPAMERMQYVLFWTLKNEERSTCEGHYSAFLTYPKIGYNYSTDGGQWAVMRAHYGGDPYIC